MSPDSSGQLDHEARIWRYMDVGRFLAMLKSRSLYFARPHEFTDLWEAQQLRRIKEEIYFETKVAEERKRKRYEQSNEAGPLRNSPEKLSESLAQVWDTFTRLAPVNCWHGNDVESIAMWKLYTSGAEGVAIQSTIGRLKAALRDLRSPFRIAPVQYIDHEKSDDTLPIEGAAGATNPLLSVLSKRQAFSHKREIRVIVDYLEDMANRARVEEGGLAPTIPCAFGRQACGLAAGESFRP